MKRAKVKTNLSPKEVEQFVKDHNSLPNNKTKKIRKPKA